MTYSTAVEWCPENSGFNITARVSYFPGMIPYKVVSLELAMDENLHK